MESAARTTRDSRGHDRPIPDPGPVHEVVRGSGVRGGREREGDDRGLGALPR